MNGVAGLNPEQRTARKRALTDELVAIRTQKADVLRQIQQIAKRQKTGGLPTKASELLATNNKLVLQMEQRNRAEKVRVCPAAAIRDDGRPQGRPGASSQRAASAAAASPEAQLGREHAAALARQAPPRLAPWHTSPACSLIAGAARGKRTQ
jgi:hypothetical protein